MTFQLLLDAKHIEEPARPAVPPVQPAYACSAGTRARRSEATGLPGVAERRQGCSETHQWSVPGARAHRAPDPPSDQLIYTNGPHSRPTCAQLRCPIELMVVGSARRLRQALQ